MILNHTVGGAGSEVVLLHGYGASLFSWRYITKELQKNYRVVEIDLPGFGESGIPEGFGFTIPEFAQQVEKTLTALGIERYALIGHSLGGGVSLAIQISEQLSDSNRIIKLVLIDSVAYPQKLPLFLWLARLPVLGKLGLRILPSKLIVRFVLYSAYSVKSRISEESILEYSKNLDTPEGRHAAYMTAANILNIDADKYIGNYKKIAVPTLLIWGRDDSIVSENVGYRLDQELVKSELVRIEDCGHIPHEEKPEQTLLSISRFLDSSL